MKTQPVCPICGGPMTGRGKTCKKCRMVAFRKPEIYICPVCGGPKSHRGKVCMKCRDSQPKRSLKNGWSYVGARTYEDLDLFWFSQFAGLFMGEGTANLQKTNQGTIAARLSLVLRSDDAGVIYDIQNHLGGSVRVDHHGKNPQHRWELGSLESIKRVCELLLEHTIIPAKKLREVEVVLRFAEWRMSQPLHGADFAYAHELLRELRELRVFKVQG